MFYVVRPLDSLWRIAGRYFGEPRRWPVIAQDNHLHDATLYVGNSLFLRDTLLVPHADAPLLDLHSDPGPAHSHQIEHRPSVVPGRAYLFVLADEINPVTRKVVRKVIVNPQLAAHFSAQLGRPIAAFPDPERFGFQPTDAASKVSLGRHALGQKPSPFSSASEHVLGEARFVGSRYWIDVEKARSSGATFHETQEILDDLTRIAAKTRMVTDLQRIEKIKRLVVSDREVLVRGAIPASGIKGVGSMALTRGVQCVQIFGFAVTAAELGLAAQKSVRVGSVKPIAAESMRQVGSWTAGWAGMKLGAVAGAAFGIETGPGAVLSAAVGSLVFGAAGYVGFDWAADMIDAN
jgi:hypothetical protein